MVEYLSNPFRENLRTDMLRQPNLISYKDIKLTVIQKKAIRALNIENTYGKYEDIPSNDKLLITAAHSWLTDDGEFYRQTGRTTALAFYYLMKAVTEEGSWVENIQEIDVRLQTQRITNNLIKVIKEIANGFDLLQYLAISENSTRPGSCSICICRKSKFEESKLLFLGKIQNG